jgi:hypothetical protein
MYHVVFANIIHAEREREIEQAIRIKRLLRRHDDAIEPHEVRDRRADEARTLTPRARPTGG